MLASALALGANRPVSWVLLGTGVMVLFVLQLLADLSRPMGRRVRAVVPAAVLYLGVLLWATLQATLPVAGTLAHPAWSEVPVSHARIAIDPIAALHNVLRLATYGMVFWIVFRAARNPARAMKFLGAIAIFVAGLSAYGVAVWAIGENPILGEAARGPVSASFVNRNSFATYAAFGLFANLVVYLHMSDGPARPGAAYWRDVVERFFSGTWLFLVGLLLCAGALLLSQSRAGALSALLGLVAVATLRRRRAGSGAWASLLALGILAFSGIVLSSGVMTRLLADPGEDARFVFYPLIREVIAERPILGHGLGGFHDAFRAYVPRELGYAEIDLAHSSYLENAVEMGLPAAVLFYLGLLWLVGLILRGALTRRQHRSFPVFATACVVAGGFHAIFDFSLQMPASAALFAAILGIGAAHALRDPSSH